MAMFANQFEVGGRLADWAVQGQSARVGAVEGVSISYPQLGNHQPQVLPHRL